MLGPLLFCWLPESENISRTNPPHHGPWAMPWISPSHLSLGLHWLAHAGIQCIHSEWLIAHMHVRATSCWPRCARACISLEALAQAGQRLAALAIFPEAKKAPVALEAALGGVWSPGARAWIDGFLGWTAQLMFSFGFALKP